MELFPPSDRILSTILTRQAERYGDRVLLVAGETRWTYAQTAAIAAASAQTLVDAGIKPGDRVALMCSNRSEFLQVFLGCAWLGAIVVPINTALRGLQLSHIFRNSQPSLLVVEAAFVSAIDTVEADVALPSQVWMIGTAAETSSAKISPLPLPALGDQAAASLVRPGDTVAILYTSGTTGPAKGVCCPQAQLFWWGIYSARALGIREGDVLFTTLPLFHTNALNAFYQAVLNGCTYVLEANSRPPASGLPRGGTTPPSAICSAPWHRCCWRSRPAGTTDRIGSASRSAAACRRKSTHRFSNDSACRWSMATDRPRPISSSRAQSRPTARGRWDISLTARSADRRCR